MSIQFKIWLEEDEARKTGFQDIIVGFLKDELHITDTNTILAMNTKEIDQSVRAKLLDRGIVTSSSPEIMARIENGISIAELVTMMAGK